jgi:hypothetical protein
MFNKLRLAFYLGVALIGIGFLWFPDPTIRTLICGGVGLYLPSAIIFKIVNVGMLGKIFPLKESPENALTWLEPAVVVGGLILVAVGVATQSFRLGQIGVASLFLAMQFRIDDKSRKPLKTSLESPSAH